MYAFCHVHAHNTFHKSYYLDKGEVAHGGEGGTVDASSAVHIDMFAAGDQQVQQPDGFWKHKCLQTCSSSPQYGLQKVCYAIKASPAITSDASMVMAILRLDVFGKQ